MAPGPRDIRDLAFRTIRDALAPIAGKKVLDVGAGAGVLAGRLAAEGAEVTALEFERPTAGPAGVTFVDHDLNTGSLPFEDERFDAIVSTEVFEHLRSPFFVLHSMVKALRPGGTLVLTIPNYWNIRYRIKYLLSGNLQRPMLQDDEKRAGYLRGLAPHINAMPFPTLHAVLTWEGCEAIELGSAVTYSIWKRLLYLPAYLPILLMTWLASRKRRTRYLLEQTNGRAALLGRRHVLLACRKRPKRPASRQHQRLCRNQSGGSGG